MIAIIENLFYNFFGDNMERQILHVDVNNAFLSWTALDMLKNGETLDIRTIPAVIGGDEKLRHGIVLAKSVLAKSAGVVTGEPLYQARKSVRRFVCFRLILRCIKNIQISFMSCFVSIRIRLNVFLLMSVLWI